MRDVGIDEIIVCSGVAKATFYRHFPSKEALVLAYMDRWYQVREDAIEEAIAHAHNPDDAILAAFTVLDDWFSRGAAEVNTFLHVVIEFGPGHLLGRAAMRHLTDIRERLCALAEAAGLEDPVGFAWSFHILTKGAMVASIEGTSAPRPAPASSRGHSSTCTGRTRRALPPKNARTSSANSTSAAARRPTRTRTAIWPDPGLCGAQPRPRGLGAVSVAGPPGNLRPTMSGSWQWEGAGMHLQVAVAAMGLVLAAPRRPRQSSRARILSAAQGLFATRGIRAVGVDELIARSGVAKSTFYRQFRSKDRLVLACLEAWGRARAGMVRTARDSHGSGREALLGVFEDLDDMILRGDPPGPLERVIVEMGAEHPLSRVAAEQLDPSLAHLEEIAAEAGLDDPASAARTFQTLICGSFVAAAEGDQHAAARAKDLAAAVLLAPAGDGFAASSPDSAAL
ncbi:TetR/AcrR family transcriptional regulator [Sinomonas atrocyanea]